MLELFRFLALDRCQLASLVFLAIRNLDFLRTLSRLLPLLSVVRVVKVQQKERVQEVKKGKAFVEFAGPVRHQVKVVVVALVGLVYLNKYFFACILVGYVTKHDVRPL